MANIKEVPEADEQTSTTHVLLTREKLEGIVATLKWVRDDLVPNNPMACYRLSQEINSVKAL